MDRLTETRIAPDGTRQFRLIGDEKWLDFDAPTVRESRLMSAVQELAERENANQPVCCSVCVHSAWNPEYNSLMCERFDTGNNTFLVPGNFYCRDGQLEA